jgi:hypothetical protein
MTIDSGVRRAESFAKFTPFSTTTSGTGGGGGGAATGATAIGAAAAAGAATGAGGGGGAGTSCGAGAAAIGFGSGFFTRSGSHSAIAFSGDHMIVRQHMPKGFFQIWFAGPLVA